MQPGWSFRVAVLLALTAASLPLATFLFTNLDLVVCRFAQRKYLLDVQLCLPLIPSDLTTVHPATADRTRTNAFRRLTVVWNPRISAADRVYGRDSR